MDYLNVPGLSHSQSLTNLSGASSTSVNTELGTAAANVHYTYELPPILNNTHPSLACPTQEALALFQEGFDSMGKVNANTVWKAGYAAARAAASTKTSRSNRLVSIKQQVYAHGTKAVLDVAAARLVAIDPKTKKKITADQVKVAGNAYVVSTQWGKFGGTRLQQATRLLNRALEARYMFSVLNESVETCMALTTKTALEVSKGMMVEGKGKDEHQIQGMEYLLEVVKQIGEVTSEMSLHLQSMKSDLQAINRNLSQMTLTTAVYLDNTEVTGIDLRVVIQDQRNEIQTRIDEMLRDLNEQLPHYTPGLPPPSYNQVTDNGG